jgi:hypothetical protein
VTNRPAPDRTEIGASSAQQLCIERYSIQTGGVNVM